MYGTRARRGQERVGDEAHRARRTSGKRTCKARDK